MRLALFVFLLVTGCSTGDAGSDCPAVPQPGQTCKAGTVCVYPKANACSPSLQTKCTNDRFVLVQGTVPPSCDASVVDGAKDAPSDSPSDSTASDSPADSPKDSTPDAD